MLELIKSLAGTPVPTILVIAGLFFLFVAIGGQFGAKIVTDRIKAKSATIVGVILLIAGVAIYWLGERVPKREGHRTEQPNLPARIQAIEQELQQIEHQHEQVRKEMKQLKREMEGNPDAQRAMHEHEIRLQELERRKQELQNELERLRRSRN